VKACLRGTFSEVEPDKIKRVAKALRLGMNQRVHHLGGQAVKACLRGTFSEVEPDKIKPDKEG
jgi:hypothetical protein